MPYKVWFRQKLSTNFLDYTESAYCIYTALGALGAIGKGININESSTSRENKENSLFINKEAE
jgi:hypothetical protein